MCAPSWPAWLKASRARPARCLSGTCPCPALLPAFAITPVKTPVCGRIWAAASPCMGLNSRACLLWARRAVCCLCLPKNSAWPSWGPGLPGSRPPGICRARPIPLLSFTRARRANFCSKRIPHWRQTIRRALPRIFWRKTWKPLAARRSVLPRRRLMPRCWKSWLRSMTPCWWMPMPCSSMHPALPRTKPRWMRKPCSGAAISAALAGAAAPPQATRLPHLRVRRGRGGMRRRQWSA